MKLWNVVMLGVGMMTVAPAYSSPNLTDVTAEDLENIVEDFSANGFHTIASAPTRRSLKFIKLFGLEVGAVGGITNTPGISGTDQDSTDFLPHASLFGAMAFPLGLGLEVSGLPEVTLGPVKAHRLGGALSWTVTDVFLSAFPIRLGTRLHYGKENVSYQQDINNTNNVTGEFDNTMWGWNVLASKKIVWIEPYVGAGFLNGDGTLSHGTVTGGQNLFNASLTTGTSASKSTMGAHLFGGLNLSSGFFNVGLEYAHVFEADRFSLKLGVSL